MPSVVQTRDARELALIGRPDVQAVIFTPAQLPGWMSDMADAVRSGRLQVPRTMLDDVTADQIDGWLTANVSADGLPSVVWDALRADVLALVGLTGEMTGASRFVFRILTATPSRHCGFHVDTVAPAAPSHGLLRVYNGEGTYYVDADNIVSMSEFYRYLGRRERLIREVADAEAGGDGEAVRAAWSSVAMLDESRPFLHRQDEVHVAPAGSTVAFKHLDVRLHWSEHPRELAWVHCSPMEGEARFLVNVMARRR